MNLQIKKTEDFYDSLKKSKTIRNYELENPLLHRHFFFKAIKELNKYSKSLIKNHANEDEFLEVFEKPKTNLPIIYVIA